VFAAVSTPVRILVQLFLTALTQLLLKHKQYANITHSSEIRNFVTDNADLKP
jgi:hypothetical protein